MRFQTVFASFSLLVTSSLLSTIQACPGHIAARDVTSTGNNSSEDAFKLGDDGPAPPATLGYTLNHFGLLVDDMDAMKHFYGEVLGMRTIFTFQASPEYEIVYMGYSHGGKNGTGYQTGTELFAEKTNVEGLLEMTHFKNGDTTDPANELKPSTKKANTFSHVGLVVPDVRQTQARMERYGVKILKGVGDILGYGSEGAEAFGFGDASKAEANSALEGTASIGFQYFLLLADPDGNLVEIQQQV